jgi:hypothetical protein
MKIIIDTENKSIILTENVNLGELFDYLEKHYKSGTEFDSGWKDYQLIVKELVDDTRPIEPPAWPSPNRTITTPQPYNPVTPDWTWRPSITCKTNESDINRGHF